MCIVSARCSVRVTVHVFWIKCLQWWEECVTYVVLSKMHYFDYYHTEARVQFLSKISDTMLTNIVQKHVFKYYTCMPATLLIMHSNAHFTFTFNFVYKTCTKFIWKDVQIIPIYDGNKHKIILMRDSSCQYNVSLVSSMVTIIYLQFVSICNAFNTNFLCQSSNINLF